MFKRALVIWIIGLLTWVPYGTWYLFFHAARDQYALYIVGVLFWIFGYWGVVGPLLSAWKVHRIMKLVERAGTLARIKEIMREEKAEDLVIEIIARENHIPEFLARKLFRAAITKLAEEKEQKEDKEKAHSS